LVRAYKQANRQRCSINTGTLSFELKFKELCPLKGDYLAPGRFKKVSAYAYERCPLTVGYKYRVLVEKSPGSQFGVRLQEMSVSRGSTVLVTLPIWGGGDPRGAPLTGSIFTSSKVNSENLHNVLAPGNNLSETLSSTWKIVPY